MTTTSRGGGQSGSEVTVLDIEDLQNYCVRETGDHLNMMILGNNKEAKKGCYIKKKIPMWDFFFLFSNIACSDGGIYYYFTLSLCQYEHTTINNKRGVEIYEKNTSRLRNHVLHGYAKEFSSFLALLELCKKSQPDDTYEISTDDVSRKSRKADKLSVGGRFSDYLLPCHPCGYNHPEKRGFEVNVVSLMAYTFISLSLLKHE